MRISSICMLCKYKHDLCVQVKNKPCVKYTVIMCLISWIRSCGSETNMQNESVLYWVYAECLISWRSLNLNNRYFSCLIKGLDGILWPNQLKQKNLLQVYLAHRRYPMSNITHIKYNSTSKKSMSKLLIVETTYRRMLLKVDKLNV